MPTTNYEPTFTLPTDQFPKGWGKSARETKRNFYEDQINQTLGAGFNEAKRLNSEEENRGAAQQRIVEDALPQANKPTWTDESFNMALGQGTSAGANDFLGGMDSLRSYLGGAGVTGGGLAAGLASNLELGRLGQITDSRRALYIERTKQDALDRARNFQNSLTYGNIVNRQPSSVYANFLNDLAGVRLGQAGLLEQRSAAKDAASAAKSAGQFQGITSLLGAGIGALA